VPVGFAAVGVVGGLTALRCGVERLVKAREGGLSDGGLELVGGAAHLGEGVLRAGVENEHVDVVPAEAGEHGGEFAAGGGAQGGRPGRAALAAEGAAGILTLPGDIPLVTAAEIDAYEFTAEVYRMILIYPDGKRQVWRMGAIKVV
jgi:hypothetical protein